MDFKKAGKALLFPHIAIMIMLIPVSAVFLVCSLVYFDTRSVTAIISYVLSFYTFTAFTVAIVSTVRYRKYNSPVYSASKIISMTAACVSMLTLESTMFATFNDGTVNEHFRRILMGASGGVVSVFIIVMALHMLFARFKTK